MPPGSACSGTPGSYPTPTGVNGGAPGGSSYSDGDQFSSGQLTPVGSDDATPSANNVPPGAAISQADAHTMFQYPPPPHSTDGQLVCLVFKKKQAGNGVSRRRPYFSKYSWDGVDFDV